MHHQTQEPSGPVTVDIVAICVTTCGGGDGNGAVSLGARVQPHEIGVIVQCEVPFSAAEWTTTDALRVPFADFDVPDKVPISIS
jgi:hypothetical protein